MCTQWSQRDRGPERGRATSPGRAHSYSRLRANGAAETVMRLGAPARAPGPRETFFSSATVLRCGWGEIPGEDGAPRTPGGRGRPGPEPGGAHGRTDGWMVDGMDRARGEVSRPRSGDGRRGWCDEQAIHEAGSALQGTMRWSIDGRRTRWSARRCGALRVAAVEIRDGERRPKRIGWRRGELWRKRSSPGGPSSSSVDRSEAPGGGRPDRECCEVCEGGTHALV